MKRMTNRNANTPTSKYEIAISFFNNSFSLIKPGRNLNSKCYGKVNWEDVNTENLTIYKSRMKIELKIQMQKSE
jgi:hypothetical protein